MEMNPVSGLNLQGARPYCHSILHDALTSTNETPGDLVPERHIGARHHHLALYDETLSCTYITPAHDDIVLGVQHQYGCNRFATLRSVTHVLLTLTYCCAQPPWAMMPPSTVTHSPVMKDAPGPARNATTRASSSG